jgi:hypothetical protein
MIGALDWNNMTAIKNGWESYEGKRFSSNKFRRIQLGYHDRKRNFNFN